MEEETDDTLDSSPELEEAEETEESEQSPELVKSEKHSQPVEATEKTVPYSRFKEVNDKLAKLEKTPPKVVNSTLDVEDYIDISASLEGLDQREKEYLATQHRLTGKNLKEIREGDDFKLWQTGYKVKVEKEKTLRPSGTQSESSKEKTVTEQIASGSLSEKEELLKKLGLYQEPRRTKEARRI